MFPNGEGGSLSKSQLHIANTIIQTGLQMGFDWRDIKIALMAGYQESRWQNLDYGMGSSVGVFQQIDSWGTVQQRRDPVWASRQFFQALRGVHGRDQMSLNDAAQAVQRSGYPDAYRQWAGLSANAIQHFKRSNGTQGAGFHAGPDPTFQPDPHSFDLTTVDKVLSGAKSPDKKRGPLDARSAPGLEAADEPLQLPTFRSRRDYNQGMEQAGFLPRGAQGVRRKLIQIAKSQLGVPYVWGGSSPQGFDCSGFTQWVYQQLGYNIPRVSYQQGQGGYNIFGGIRRDLGKLKPGDMVFWDNSSRNNGADHVAIYLGGGKIIEAPRPGRSVSISDLYDLDQAWGVHLNL